jgi:uncharacterized membrane protein
VRRPFAIGLGSLLGGIALYLGTAVAMLSYYDEHPRPGWLTALWLVATAFVVLGLLVMVDGAVRAFRERA